MILTESTDVYVKIFDLNRDGVMGPLFWQGGINEGQKALVTVLHGAFAMVTMPTPQKSLQAIEMDHIIRVLEETKWRIDGPQGAALILDMNPSTLRSRMRKLGIQKP